MAYFIKLVFIFINLAFSFHLYIIAPLIYPFYILNNMKKYKGILIFYIINIKIRLRSSLFLFFKSVLENTKNTIFVFSENCTYHLNL